MTKSKRFGIYENERAPLNCHSCTLNLTAAPFLSDCPSVFLIFMASQGASAVPDRVHFQVSSKLSQNFEMSTEFAKLNCPYKKKVVGNFLSFAKVTVHVT